MWGPRAVGGRAVPCRGGSIPWGFCTPRSPPGPGCVGQTAAAGAGSAVGRGLRPPGGPGPRLPGDTRSRHTIGGSWSRRGCGASGVPPPRAGQRGGGEGPPIPAGCDSARGRGQPPPVQVSSPEAPSPVPASAVSHRPAGGAGPAPLLPRGRGSCGGSARVPWDGRAPPSPHRGSHPELGSGAALAARSTRGTRSRSRRRPVRSRRARGSSSRISLLPGSRCRKTRPGSAAGGDGVALAAGDCGVPAGRRDPGTPRRPHFPPARCPGLLRQRGRAGAANPDVRATPEVPTPAAGGSGGPGAPPRWPRPAPGRVMF